MDYSLYVENSIESLAYCMQELDKKINDVCDWKITIKSGYINYGIYLNFDVERRELEINNQPIGYNDSLTLNEIIDKINEFHEDEEE